MPVDVCSVNLARRLALLTTGEMVAIHTFLDNDGEDTDDPSQATGFITEADTSGNVWSDTLSSYSEANTRH
jgi:hypothetical protein